MAAAVPEVRIAAGNPRPVRPDGEFVLYWMTAARRTSSNFALDRAGEWALRLDRPLLVLEALRCGHRWAAERFHRFVIAGMRDNALALARSGVRYYPYLEPAPGAGRGLLEALGRRAAVVVTDDFPCFFLPRMVRAAARDIPVRLEAIDGNGLLPLRAAERPFPTAHAFRRFLQRELPAHLGSGPARVPPGRRGVRPLRALPAAVVRRWPPVPPAALDEPGALLARLPIDHAVGDGGLGGGQVAGRAALRRFLERRLPSYGERRHAADGEASSGLSPYLHFGHLSAHEVFAGLARREGWSPARLGRGMAGRRAGWWGMSAPAEAFLDQLVTWRELGYLFCAHRPDYDRFDSLPAWALATLAKHSRDARPHRYSRADLEAAATHDPLWNAAQTQLVSEGRMPNTLRMLWGKKILEWSPSPQEALASMVELNNKYALDGRDPNSYSGIFWCLGRFDHPWGPERPIFGTVRYMSSASTARKLAVGSYLARFGPREPGGRSRG